MDFVQFPRLLVELNQGTLAVQATFLELTVGNLAWCASRPFSEFPGPGIGTRNTCVRGERGVKKRYCVARFALWTTSEKELPKHGGTRENY